MTLPTVEPIRRLELVTRFRRFTPTPLELEHFERGLATLAQRVAYFPRKSLHLDVRGQPKRSRFEMTLTLDLPHRQLVVGDSDVRQSFPTAWRRCVKKLEHRLDAYRQRMSGKDRGRQYGGTKETPRVAAERGAELQRLWKGGDFAGFSEEIQDLRVDLVRHVQRIQGSSPSPDLPEDHVVEAVLCLAFEEFGRRPVGVSFLEWLQGLVPRAFHDLHANRGNLLERAGRLRGASPTGAPPAEKRAP